MRETVPKAVQDCHDLLRWLIPHLDKFPRARRLGVGLTLIRHAARLHGNATTLPGTMTS